MKLAVIYTLLFAPLFLSAQKVDLVLDAAARKVDVTVDGKPFTSYIFLPDSVLKRPVLYPVYSAGGTPVTRGFPFAPRSGERVDHPHQIGVWMAHEFVNGFDFWNNKKELPDRSRYGTILHTHVLKAKSGKGKGVLKVAADWMTADGKGKKVLTEATTFTFRAKDAQRIIDRTTTLTAMADTVFFKDMKDGFFAIRLARELEHPSEQPDVFVDARGVATKMDKMDNSKVTGRYRSSEGLEGEAVWGKRAGWMNLSGRIGQENLSVCIIDHPKNLNYPTYWHARGYGLLSANPLGAKIFSDGKKELNFKLPPGKSVTFRYRTVVASEHLADAAIKRLAAEFSTEK